MLWFEVKRVFFVGSCALVFFAGCGYSLRTSRTESFLKKNQIHRVYIRPLENRTYRAGIENVVYNAVVRSFGGTPGVRVVSSREDADAELTGSIEQANREVSGLIKASDVSPIGRGSPNLLVATEYLALIRCSFSLKRLGDRQTDSVEIWKSDFSRQKPFPGNNQVWSLGSTSALINESEFDRALVDVSTLVAQDAIQSILESF